MPRIIRGSNLSQNSLSIDANALNTLCSSLCHSINQTNNLFEFVLHTEDYFQMTPALFGRHSGITISKTLLPFYSDFYSYGGNLPFPNLTYNRDASFVQNTWYLILLMFTTAGQQQF
jgi:hypothetical protein